METYAVYFRPKGGLASRISSDTLFGAVCWGIQVLGLKPDVGKWLLEKPSPPFAFSAPFPAWFRNAEPLLRCYPRPATLTLLPSQVRKTAAAQMSVLGQAHSIYSAGKKLKEVLYLSEGALAFAANGLLSFEELLGTTASDYLQAGGFMLLKKEAEQLKKARIYNPGEASITAEVQHNSVDRVAGATVKGSLFYRDVTFFARQAGLWALVEAESEEMNRLIAPALRYLADTGLGADRSTGCGHFDISIREAPPLPHASSPNAVMMMSRYLPDEQDGVDFTRQPLAYQLVTLRPKRESRFPKEDQTMETPPVYKGAVRMFEPGSVFPLTKRRKIYGRLVEVVPAASGGPVYQSGAAVPLFLNVRGG